MSETGPHHAKEMSNTDSGLGIEMRTLFGIYTQFWMRCEKRSFAFTARHINSSDRLRGKSDLEMVWTIYCDALHSFLPI